MTGIHRIDECPSSFYSVCVISHVLGKDYDTFLDRVYEMIPESERETYLNYANVNSDTRKATDEFNALNFEGMNVTNPGLWTRVKDAVRSMLKKLGVKYDASDAEIEYLLRMTYREEMKNARKNADAETKTYKDSDGTMFSARPLLGDKKLHKGLRELEEGKKCHVEHVFTEIRTLSSLQ